MVFPPRLVLRGDCQFGGNTSTLGETPLQTTGVGRLCFAPSTRHQPKLLAAVVKLTVVAGENLTVGSTVWLPAESVAPGR